MSILVSHPTGNANLRAALEGIEAGGNLLEFHTCIATNSESLWLKLLPASVRKELLRRSFGVTKNKIKAHPGKEFLRLALPKIGIRRYSKHESGSFSVDAVYHALDKQVSKRLEKLTKTSLKMFYGYEDGSLNSILTAKKLGIQAVYDLPIGYWKSSRRLLSEEMYVNPDWANTLTGFKDSQEKLARKDQELSHADHILVASSFTKKTLEDFSGSLNPIHVIPYGFPVVKSKKHYHKNEADKLKLLFVGGLSQRKGISYMLEAVKKYPEYVDLTIIGRKPVDDCAPLNQMLETYRWIESLPHQEILSVMREHDILVFPSLFEGFGLVITEAMSQGVPVIATDRTCGPDLIRHGENGWIVEAGKSEGIEEVIDEVLQNRALVEEIGTRAIDAAARRPWSVYGEELNSKLESFLDQQNTALNNRG